MERSLLKRALPWIEGLCFAGAWIVGISVAVHGRPERSAPSRERDVVTSGPRPGPADLSGPQRLFRPIPHEEIQEGG